MLNRIYFLVTFLILACCSPQTARAQNQNELNVASPDKHPYADTAGGRESHRLANETVNGARLYDFYQRQADYYMATSERPKILPAFPGLDSGQHGHWGKHNQNKHEDGRWNDLIRGPAKAGVLRTPGFTVGKAVTVDLRSDPAHKDETPLTVCFDPQSFTYRILWAGEVYWHPYRWGTSRNMNMQGESIFSIPDSTGYSPGVYPVQSSSVQGTVTDRTGYSGATDGWGVDSEKGIYHGFYSYENRTVFSYSIDGIPVLDSPGREGQSVFCRVLEFPEGVKRELRARVFTPSKKTDFGRVRDDSLVYISEKESVVISTRGNGALEVDSSGSVWLKIFRGGENSRAEVCVFKGSPDSEIPLQQRLDPGLSRLTRGGGPLWPQTFSVKGQLGNEDKAYAVDTIPLPSDNPWKTVLQLSGIDFFPNEEALVTTLQGDVWRVTGLDETLEEVTWRRFATGLHQPLGMLIDEDGIFILGRDQITRLHDLDNDGEADFYEKYANDFGSFFKSHSHTFGLGRTSDRAFHFVARDPYHAHLRRGKSQDRRDRIRRAQLHGLRREPRRQRYCADRAAGRHVDSRVNDYRSESGRILRSSFQPNRSSRICTAALFCAARNRQLHRGDGSHSVRKHAVGTFRRPHCRAFLRRVQSLSRSARYGIRQPPAGCRRAIARRLRLRGDARRFFPERRPTLYCGPRWVG